MWRKFEDLGECFSYLNKSRSTVDILNEEGRIAIVYRKKKGLIEWS